MWNSVVLIQNTHSLITEKNLLKYRSWKYNVIWENLQVTMFKTTRIPSDNMQRDQSTFYWNTEEELKEHFN